MAWIVEPTDVVVLGVVGRAFLCAAPDVQMCYEATCDDSLVGCSTESRCPGFVP